MKLTSVEAMKLSVEETEDIYRSFLGRVTSDTNTAALLTVATQLTYLTNFLEGRITAATHDDE